MSDFASHVTLADGRGLAKAVHQNRALSRAGMSERLFTWLFSGLVYPQIWEDPEVDMAAMELAEGQRIVAIASGGCNVLAYLTRGPAAIDAVDLNPAHIALNRLKLAAVARLPQQADLMRFFGGDGHAANVAAYDRFLAPHLDRATRAYWEARTWRGRRRIAVFTRNFYRTGLLGLFIAAGHRVARLHGVDVSRIMEAPTLSAQRRFFEAEIAPLFERPLIRFALGRKASLFGLGIPPAQYDRLLSAGSDMAEVLKARLEKLSCGFPLDENYFAWQAFARRYPRVGDAALPAYLEPAHFDTIRRHAGRVRLHQRDVTSLLRQKAAAAVDRFVLLDAQDWMTDRQLTELWTEITRTAAPGARVIFRTAAAPSLLPGRIPAHVLDAWTYEEDASHALSARDRSAIYGGFHLYVKNDR